MQAKGRPVTSQKLLTGRAGRATKSEARIRKTRKLIAHVLIIAFGSLMLYPLVWMLFASFKPQDEIFSSPGLLPQTWTIDNFVTGWTGIGYPFSNFFLNSFVVAATCVVGNLFSCSLAAYAFARLEFRFKPVLFGLMLGTIMLPFHVVLVPQYILFHTINWTNTYLPLVVPKFLAVDAFFIFLMVQFIRGLPRELDDAATVDGCGPIAVFWRIMTDRGLLADHASAHATRARGHGGVHVHLDLERLPHTSALLDRSQQVHGSRGAQCVPRFVWRLLLGPDVCHVTPQPRPSLCRLHPRPEAACFRHRDGGNQITE